MMKRLFWVVFGILSLFGMVVYEGNVLVIGEHLGRLFGGGASPNPCVMYTWDVLAGLSPFLILAWIIGRNILGYRELNLREIGGGEDEEVMDRVMKDLYGQKEGEDCMLDKCGLRSQCGYLLRNGSRGEKADFLRNYFQECHKEARKQCNQYAIFAAVSVVLSPKSAGDTLALLMWQCRIISATLRVYGGRPRALGVMRLYLRVLMHSFLVGSIDEVLDQFAFGAVDIKFLSLVTQAVGATATCVRTASLTRYYLENGIGRNQKEALHASMKEIPGGIVEVMISEEMKIAVEKFLHCGLQVSKVVGKSMKKGVKNVISLFSSEKSQGEEEQESSSVEARQEATT